MKYNIFGAEKFFDCVTSWKSVGIHVYSW